MHSYPEPYERNGGQRDVKLFTLAGDSRPIAQGLNLKVYIELL